MKSKTATWFEVVVRYIERQDDHEKNIRENYVVEAETFTEAEAIINRHLEGFKGLFIKNISPCTFREVFFAEDNQEQGWFKAKLAFMVYDDKTDKEKRDYVNYLVQAADLQGALDNINEVMKASMTEYVTANISEAKISEVMAR